MLILVTFTALPDSALVYAIQGAVFAAVLILLSELIISNRR
jgi:uncharacterized membrane protein